MIRPKIPLVQNGQRLTSDLVNSMIHRTEYAADLLRQYRLTAGTEMYVEPHYDGTRVSYLQPVGGGQILPPPIQAPEFSIVGYYGYSGAEAIPFIYSNGTYTTLVNPFPNLNNETYLTAIRNGIICGFFYWGEDGSPYYGYSTSFYIKNGQWTYFRYPDDPLRGPVNIEAYGTDGNQIIGTLYSISEGADIKAPGFIYSINSENFQYVYNPTYPTSATPTIFNDINNNIIVGGVQNFGFIYQNSSFQLLKYLSYATRFTGIYENKITGTFSISADNISSFIYENNNFTVIKHPDSGNKRSIFEKLYKNYVVGWYNDTTDGDKYKGFLYNNNNWETIMYPGSEYTFCYGIG